MLLDLREKRRLAEQNCEKMYAFVPGLPPLIRCWRRAEAEAAWVERHKELLTRFKQRTQSQVSSSRAVTGSGLTLGSGQDDMEHFISDQIVEKLDVVVRRPHEQNHWH